jgi:outer membrane murein-binding lipoprotein Lpp
MINKRYRRLAAAALVVTGIAACSDNPASPTNAVPTDADVLAAMNAPAAAPVKAPRASINAAIGDANPADTLAVSFQVGPEGGVFPLGRHWISFPANSVCDMSQTSYGEGEWNQLCPIASEPVTIDAIVFADSTGSPRVEFAQHLRFDPTKQVILHMTFDYREGDVAPDILWHRNEAAQDVDEGDIDPAMVTREGDEWMVYRRVKHFSGYTVSTGFLRVDVGGESLLGVDIGLDRLSSTPSRPQPLQSGHVVATGRKHFGQP